MLTSVVLRTVLSDTRGVRGSEFVRRVQALGKERAIAVRWAAHRAKGRSRPPLLWGEYDHRTQLKDEIDKRAYHKMLKQLGLSERDF